MIAPERTLRAVASALCLAMLSACASQAPPVDEERIARRVVALLRREGLVVSARDGGVARRDRDDDSEATEEGADDDPNESAEDEPDGAGAAPQAPSESAQVAQLMRALNASAARAAARGGALRERPTATVPPAQLSVVTGAGDGAAVFVPLDGAISIGPDDALVTVVTFMDAQCPFCARLLPALREMQRAHAGEMRLVLRHRPLSFHRAAWAGAVYVEFARSALGADGAFRAMEQCLTHTSELDRPRFDLFAADLGLDPIHLADALDASEPTDFDRNVMRDDALGESAHATGTPMTYFNGRLVSGAQPREALDRAYDDARDRARRALARGVRRNALYETLCRTPDATPAPRRTPARAP